MTAKKYIQAIGMKANRQNRNGSKISMALLKYSYTQCMKHCKAENCCFIVLRGKRKLLTCSIKRLQKRKRTVIFTIPINKFTKNSDKPNDGDNEISTARKR